MTNLNYAERKRGDSGFVVTKGRSQKQLFGGVMLRNALSSERGRRGKSGMEEGFVSDPLRKGEGYLLMPLVGGGAEKYLHLLQRSS